MPGGGPCGNFGPPGSLLPPPPPGGNLFPRGLPNMQMNQMPGPGSIPPPPPQSTPPPAAPVPVSYQEDPIRWLDQQKAEMAKAEQATKAAAAEGQAFVGVVARIIPAAAVGAIQCAESAQRYGGNVQIPKDQLGDLKISDSVVFKVAQNALGIPQVTFAKRLEALSLQRQRLLEVEFPLPGPNQPESQVEFLGFVTSFNPEAGYGLLSCAQTRQQYGQDVYIHRDQFEDLNISDAVKFKVALNSKGQPVARSVRKATTDAAAPQAEKKRKRSRSRSSGSSRSGSRDRRASRRSRSHDRRRRRSSSRRR